MVRVEKTASKVAVGAEPMIGEVLKIGPDVKGIEEKDIVTFSPYGFDEIMVKDEKLVVISDTLILAIYEEKERPTKIKG